MVSTELLDSIDGCLQLMASGQALPLTLFLAGLVGGATHCVAMCGPFVISQAGQVEKLRQAALLPYHLGRITTYVAMAMLLSSVLNLAFLFLPVRSLIIAPVLMLAGLIFIVNAFPSLTAAFPWINKIAFSVPYQWLHKGFQKLSVNAGSMKRYAMGMLLGFMPCGLIVSALMAASTAPGAWQAGLAMAAFGAGTMIPLMAVAFGGVGFQKKFPRAMRRATQILMVWSGLWLFIMAGWVLI